MISVVKWLIKCCHTVILNSNNIVKTQNEANTLLIIYLVALLLLLVGFLVIENIFHLRTLKKIPVRIHVNGTRGKSSVARLIAAGMRGAGLRTCVKTTGTDARMIDPEGNESPVYRVGYTNVIEQVKVMRWAVKNNAKAIVIECMALQPLLQSLCERRIVQSTHGVLTNARPDHLDVMGPSERDVAMAMAGTMTVNGDYFTSEREHLDFFEYAAKDRGSIIHSVSDKEIDDLTDEEMRVFSYTEFKVNVALALKVCEALGLDRAHALKGMWGATPDPGALREYPFEFRDKSYVFANAFAANDPVSTLMLWNNLLAKYSNCNSKVLVVNCRQDRQDRSNQLAEAITTWEKPDVILLIGTGTEYFVHYYKKYVTEVQREHVMIKVCENEGVETIYGHLVEMSLPDPYLLVGVGNIKGIGMEIIDYCEKSVGA